MMVFYCLSVVIHREHKMESYCQVLPPARQARGWSRITAETLVSEGYADQYQNLERVVQKWTLYRAVDDGATALGIPRVVKDLLLQLLKYCRDADFSPGKHPLVWPSNADLAEKLGIQPRQVINRVNTAIGMGLLLRAEGNAPRRNGARNRDTGDIVWARGLDLRPLVVRHHEFVKALAEQKIETKLRKEQLRKLAIVWRRCGQLVDLLLTIQPGHELIDAVQGKAIAMRTARDRKDRSMIEAMIIELNQFAEELAVACRNAQADQAQETCTETDIIASNGAKNCTRTTNTNQFIKLSKDNTCNDPLPNRSSADLFEANGRRLESVPDGFEEEADQLTITPEMLVEASPALEMLMDPRAKVTWKSIYGASMELRRDLGISRDAIAEAMTIMGPVKTVLAIAIAGGRRDEIENPGGWMRALCDRDIEGKLHLTKSIYGLLQRYGKHKSRSSVKQPTDTMAEPPAPPPVSAAAIELLAAVSDPTARDTLTALFRRAPDLCVEDDGETLTLLQLPAVVVAELQAHHEAQLKQIASTYGLKATVLRSELEQDPWVISPDGRNNQSLRTSDLLTVLAKTAKPGQLAAWVREINFNRNKDELEVIVQDDRTATALQTHFWSAMRVAASRAGCTDVSTRNLAREGEG
jgi:replication initiation protein RepC